MDLTKEEQQRWIEHLEKYKSHCNRYNPNTSSTQKYMTLASAYYKLGSIGQVMRTHNVGRNTVINALQFVKRMEDETRTLIPQGVEAEQNLPPVGAL